MDGYKLLDKKVIYFDGVCNLCNFFVQFIIKHDNKKQFFFVSLQSDIARNALPKTFTYQNTKPLKSIVYTHQDQIKTRSDAVLSILKDLGGLWKIIYAFIIIPSFLRNPLYDIIAKYRYFLFGKKTQCVMPTSEIKSRFIH